MADPQALHLSLAISSPGSTDEELDQMTRQLLSQLKDLRLESVSLAKGDQDPVGTKGVDAVTVEAIVMTVLPTMLPQFLEFLQSWTLQSKGRTMKFKGKIVDQQVEVEGLSRK